jgi:ribose transport system ATP-binding protein
MKGGRDVELNSSEILTQEILIELTHVTKIFPGVTALDNVDLSIKKGEIHVLLGENGAGKSTLIKVIAGVELPNSGEIFWQGQKVEIKNTREAHHLGISIIYQELSSVPCLSVAENMFMGREIRSKYSKSFINLKEQKRRTREALKMVNLDVSPDTLMEQLGVGKRQMIEIAKAIDSDSKLIIMDEPTSSLSRREIDELLVIMRRLKESGISILFITHKLEEAKKVGDIVTVLKDGKKVSNVHMGDVDEGQIIKMMVGRELTEKYPKRKPSARETVALRVENLNSPKFTDVSFEVRQGEILGIFGLVGAGRTEVARAIYGVDPLKSGHIYIDGKEIDINSPEDAIKNGLVLLTENRKEEGLVLMHDVVENVTLPSMKKFLNKSGFLNKKEQTAATKEYVSVVNLRPPDLVRNAMNFSGGNQQKIVIARWLLSKARIFIFDEPTRGIDVGAKTEVYTIMNELLENGAAIIMISSEMQEIIGMSDRVVVMYEGKVTGQFEKEEIKSQESILIAATGGIKS